MFFSKLIRPSWLDVQLLCLKFQTKMTFLSNYSYLFWGAPFIGTQCRHQNCHHRWNMKKLWPDSWNGGHYRRHLEFLKMLKGDQSPPGLPKSIKKNLIRHFQVQWKYHTYLPDYRVTFGCSSEVWYMCRRQPTVVAATSWQSSVRYGAVRPWRDL